MNNKNYSETLDSVPEKLKRGIAKQRAGQLLSAKLIYQSVLKEQPLQADALHLLGTIYQHAKHYEQAAELIEKAIKINPRVSDYYNNCGTVYHSLDKDELSIARYEKALELSPKFAEAHNNLGVVYRAQGRLDDAIACYERAISIKPDYAEAHNNLGNSIGINVNAIKHFKQAIAINSEYAEAHLNLGIVCKGLGRLNDATDSLKKAIEIKSDYAEAYQCLGNIFNELGRKNNAKIFFKKALAIKPDFAEAHESLSFVNPILKNASVIEDLISSPSVSEEDLIHYHFALGKIYEANEMYDLSFESYQKANGLKRKSITYVPKKSSAYIDQIIRVYSKQYVQDKASFGSESELPVFIVGMPRSGTTLVEQIVSSHPQVTGAGEISLLSRIENGIADKVSSSNNYPECMLNFSDSFALACANEYLTELVHHSSSSLRITDKMPHNFLRIGLINTLFPRARIIHCHRNALDTCASIYLNYFKYSHNYSFDLQELGYHYLDYRRLMDHWQHLYPSKILNVEYEALVLNQENISKEIIDYLGLDWDETCLDFHKNKRAVKTASNLQVRKPIYKNSISRWKKYESHLGPLISILKQTN
jgi:tetratricopeptide (TPR) repeat protein